MRARFSLVLVCLLCLLGFAQDTETGSRDLKFEDYATTDAEAFQGTPARPQIVEKKHREFRTAITDAARKGPNFAGHYTVAEWGCGSGCVSLAVVDEATGKVFSAPFGILTLPFTEGTADEPAHEFQGAVYQLNSRLFIADGCPEEKKCATYYYEWKDDKFNLLSIVPQRGPAAPDNSGEQ